MLFSQLNGDPCPAWTTERGKLKRGWSPGDSLNLVRVLSVRVNYSQHVGMISMAGGNILRV